MINEGLTYGKMARSGFPHSVAKYLTDEAGRMTTARPGYHSSGRTASVLTSLAGYVQAIGSGDQRVRALELCQPGAEFEPGQWQQRFIANVAGIGKPALDNSDALHELLGLAIEDLKDRITRGAGGLREDIERRDKELARLASIEASEAEAREDRDRLRSLLDQRTAELAEANDSLEFFRRLVGDDATEDAQAPAAEKPSRNRVKLEGEDNIWYRDLASGDRSFIVGYWNPAKAEGKGGQEWDSTHVDLESAQRRRAELVEQGVIKAKVPA